MPQDGKAVPRLDSPTVVAKTVPLLKIAEPATIAVAPAAAASPAVFSFSPPSTSITMPRAVALACSSDSSSVSTGVAQASTSSSRNLSHQTILCSSWKTSWSPHITSA